MWEGILSAIDCCDQKLLSYYLKREPALVFEHNYQNETLLHFAARKPDASLTAELLKFGAKADIQDEFGWTPLHEAAAGNNEAVARLLIESHINLNILSRKSESSLMVAAKRNATGIMARLLTAGAKKQLTNRKGDTALHIAVNKGNLEATKVLLLAGAKTSVRNLEGYAPLHLAAIRGNLRCAELLLEFGADPDQPDHKGRSFLDIAGIFGKTIFIQLLKNQENHGKNEKTKVITLDKTTTLQEFYSDSTDQPGKKLRSTAENLINGLFWGHLTPVERINAGKILEVSLWFIVFPMLVYCLYQSFNLGYLPAIVSFSRSSDSLTLQHILNTGLIFLLSYSLITTEKGTFSLLHFFKDLRESIHFRVLHLSVIEILFSHHIPMNTDFVGNFITFWFWFVMLYSLSYMFWWTNIHMSSGNDMNEEVNNGQLAVQE
ncbi:MAG: ankyrin repeat domain-containing protein [Candidatus Rifleibacteriota bacterium]